MTRCVGARLAHSIQLALNITDIETIFWSDSMVTLFWLRDKGDWSVFVANRIKETKLLFPKSDWHHIPGNMNPADLISRGCSPIRPIQRIFPLEASGSDFQELLNPPADSSMKTLDNDGNLPQVSRFGREIKKPNRL
ncbi:integrase catalytic domain-containing protein [Trichonephila inaurata madagascariensis]|uniref:Integrase catalytic domain-containing protein n=1 Tax=Trichonephila inaurata madagascariensis TaxID=2747483 RepID=A0A8X6YFM2_9ARAC|nr:integrase catalytic domain-containing protein [Trichonephila inaurata madagascariensis]